MKKKRPKKSTNQKWIEKDKKNIIPKLSKKSIFIPSRNELTF